jgi:hypothetical protein
MECPLLRTFQKIKVINDVYESQYVHKCLIVCGFSDLHTMYHMKHMLERLDFPVDVLTVLRANDVLTRFTKHSLRTLIVGELCGAMMETHLRFLADQIDLVFVDGDSVVDKSWIMRAFDKGQRVVML